jgi:aryl-alcohol dehydrogenase-like predicted oxidoreductase
MHPAFAPRVLGRTGILSGRIGLASGYGCPAAAVEHAFDMGLNYFYWGSIRRGSFASGLRNLMTRRDRLTLVIQTYSRVAALIPLSLERALRNLGTDHADILLLGLWNKQVPDRILDTSLRLRERGLARHLALSTHHRPLVAQLAANSPYDILHLRYNAVHTGAERDIFPKLPEANPPGLVAFTATSWKQLLNPRKTPPGERTVTASDCYRFVLTQPAIDVCLAGPANDEQFRAVAAALDAGPMLSEELSWMRRVGAAIYAGSKPMFPRK